MANVPSFVCTTIPLFRLRGETSRLQGKRQAHALQNSLLTLGIS